MVRRRGQSCNTTTTKRTLPDEMRTWDAMRCCFGIKARKIVDGHVELDFRHSY
jgi:hypothetical protein